MNSGKPSDDFSSYYASLLEGSYDCVDRITVDAYFAMGQTGGGLRQWWRQWKGSDKGLSDAGLKALAAKHKSIQDVRGLGSMIAIELFKNGDHSQPDADLTKRVCVEALKRGLVLLSCGTYGNVIRLLVPLTAPDAQLAEGLDLLGQALAAAQA